MIKESKINSSNINPIYSDKTYLTNNNDWHQLDSAWKASHINNILKKNKIFPSAVADIGCGSGDIIYNLSKIYKKTHFTGYEVSPIAYKIAKKKITKNIKFRLLNFRSLKKNNEWNDKKKGRDYDCLLCIDVFEHVEDYIHFLKSLKNKAKYKIFHVPLDLNLSTSLRSQILIWARYFLGHLHYFNKETALETLKYCQYKIVDCYITAPIFISKPTTIKQFLIKLLAKFICYFSKDLAAKLFYGFSLIILTK
jgi:2-polyprenyl-3-methyl-5-hydroxy-6-metoxy-1,4-benzoquinol methylase